MSYFFIRHYIKNDRLCFVSNLQIGMRSEIISLQRLTLETVWTKMNMENVVAKTIAPPKSSRFSGYNFRLFRPKAVKHIQHY